MRQGVSAARPIGYAVGEAATRSNRGRDVLHWQRSSSALMRFRSGQGGQSGAARTPAGPRSRTPTAPRAWTSISIRRRSPATSCSRRRPETARVIAATQRPGSAAGSARRPGRRRGNRSPRGICSAPRTGRSLRRRSASRPSAQRRQSRRSRPPMPRCFAAGRCDEADHHVSQRGRWRDCIGSGHAPYLFAARGLRRP
jgi:hypothetical protein